MNQNCAKCSEIINLEKILDECTNNLINKVIDFCAPVRLKNNESWEKFAKICRIPIIGDLYLKIKKWPKLEEEPSYIHEQWYETEGSEIEKEAKKLECLKKEHLEHWGDEKVEVCEDAGGDIWMEPRAKAYAEKHHVFVPDKYDYSTGAGIRKLDANVYVMCFTTKKIVLRNDCCGSFGPEGSFWWLSTGPEPKKLRHISKIRRSLGYPD